MEVILIKDVENLGYANDIVAVSRVMPTTT